MWRIFVMLLCLTAFGCAVVPADEGLFSSRLARPAKALTKIEEVKIGMSREIVASLMGSELTIGYTKNPLESNQLEAVKVSQPHKEETIVSADGEYQILYYFFRIHRSDGLISEEELMPLIFKDDQLIGKGFEDLENLRRKSLKT